MKKKKQMSILKTRLIAGGLILIIVSCWVFIGVSVTVKIKGFEKAKATTALSGIYGCTLPEGKTACADGSCSGGGACSDVVVGGIVTCGCASSVVGPVGVETSKPINNYSNPTPVAVDTVSLTKTGAYGLALCDSCTDKCSNGNSCEEALIGGKTYCACPNSVSGPSSILNGTYSVTNVPASYSNIGTPVLVGSATLTKTGAVGLTTCGSCTDKCSNGNSCESAIIGGSNVCACVSSVASPLSGGINGSAY